MLLSFHSEATFIVWLAAAYLSQHTFKVGIKHVGRFHLFIKVCEKHLVFPNFWHLRFSRTFQQSLAFRFVPFKQISRCVSVRAAFGEMFAVRILALVEQ